MIYAVSTTLPPTLPFIPQYSRNGSQQHHHHRSAKLLHDTCRLIRVSANQRLHPSTRQDILAPHRDIALYQLLVPTDSRGHTLMPCKRWYNQFDLCFPVVCVPLSTPTEQNHRSMQAVVQSIRPPLPGCVYAHSRLPTRCFSWVDQAL